MNKSDLQLNLIKEKKPVFVHGSGVKKNLGKTKLWQDLLNAKVYGGIRGPISHKHLQSIDIDLNVLGDAAFFLFDKKNWNDESRTDYDVLINMGTHKYYPESAQSRKSIELFIEKIINDGYYIKFLPFHQIDFEIGIKLKKKFPAVRLLNVPESYEECLEHFRKSCFAVGERLHFNIMATLGKCPFYSINYEEKHSDFLTSIDLEEYGCNMSEVLPQTIITQFKNRKQFRWGRSGKKLFAFKKLQIVQAEKFSKWS